MSIGQRIKEARIYKQMTMEELGKIIGVRRATISRYESGEIGVNSHKIEAIASALECSPAYLMGWTDHPGQYTVMEAADYPKNEREEFYLHNSTENEKVSEKRKQLQRIVMNATEEELDKIIQIIGIVSKKKTED